jgi:hypothetical protein
MEMKPFINMITAMDETNAIGHVYLTRIFAEFLQCDARVSNFDLKDFRRIKRSSDEVLAELDDKICEENELKYQFQVYERINL